jgi:glyoxylase-like metal-dependent hydrolase (beta-lactamase superfamily II)
MLRLIHTVLSLTLLAVLITYCSTDNEDGEALFDMVEVSGGIYAAIAKPAYKLNGNAAVIVNEDDVVVVDTHSKPSAARALVKQIDKLTSKPIRHVILSHFHYDHARGNQAYIPPVMQGVSIISSMETRKNLIEIAPQRLQNETDNMPNIIAGLQKDASDPDSEKTLLAAREYYDELKTMRIILPDLTFENSLTLHKKNRDIQLLFLGRGHTSSDIVVYLPGEKVLVTSDLLTPWLPGMGDGYPNDWITTLEQMAKLDIEQIIVGHGDVSGKQLIDTLRNYLSDLIAAVREQVGEKATLQQTQDTVFTTIAQKYAGLYPTDGFEFRVKRNIKKVFTDIMAEKY